MRRPVLRCWKFLSRREPTAVRPRCALIDGTFVLMRSAMHLCLPPRSLSRAPSVGTRRPRVSALPSRPVVRRGRSAFKTGASPGKGGRRSFPLPADRGGEKRDLLSGSPADRAGRRRLARPAARGRRATRKELLKLRAGTSDLLPEARRGGRGAGGGGDGIRLGI